MAELRHSQLPGESLGRSHAVSTDAPKKLVNIFTTKTGPGVRPLDPRSQLVYTMKSGAMHALRTLLTAHAEVTALHARSAGRRRPGKEPAKAKPTRAPLAGTSLQHILEE